MCNLYYFDAIVSLQRSKDTDPKMCLMIALIVQNMNCFFLLDAI